MRMFHASCGLRGAAGVLAATGVWLFLAAGSAAAKQAPPVASRAVAFGVSAPLRDLLPADQSSTEPSRMGKRAAPRAVLGREPAAAPASRDGAAQRFALKAMPTPSLVFAGLTSEDNLAAFGLRFLPPDTGGDVGPDHYVQVVNVLLRVFDKTGAPLTAPVTLGSLFTGPGISPECAGHNDGTPIVLHDPLADRWLVSQVCRAADPANHQLIAISQTGDPTGSYYLYDFQMPNTKLLENPKLGVWTDAYYMAGQQFNPTSFAYQGTGVFALDRAKMLAGDPTASFVYFDVENGNILIDGMLPADVDGITPPPPNTPGYFAYFTATEFLDPSDALRLFELRPSFTNPASSTFVERAESPLAVAPFDPRSPSGRAHVEQPPPATSTAYLDSITDRLMFRLAYRNFGTHESLAVTHTVNVSGVNPTTAATMRAGVRYYELRRGLPAGAFVVQEQATFAPADGLERWMGSAAMDGSGNLAVGYSSSSTTSFPSIRYAGRLAGDTPGGLLQGEAVLVAGTGVQTSSTNRWGGHSALTVDPEDDCTFWYTNEYYTAASQALSSVSWLTAIGTFTFPGCVPGPRGTLRGTVRDAASNAPLAGATVTASNGFVRTTDAAGAYSMTVPPGSYSMTASAPGYGGAVHVSGVTVTNGGTTVRDFALSPSPILGSDGGSLVAESCGAGNGALDPEETVTVSLRVENTGAAATVNLVGTLLPTGGVASPGPPQSYGVIPVGGSVARSFTFRATGACGGTLVATLQLQDGARDFGTVAYSFTLGLVNPIVLPPVTYSSGNLSVPIPDAGVVEIPLAISDTGVVADVDMRVRLDHTFVGDLAISLVGPDGTAVDLSSNNGASGDDYGSGADNCSGQTTEFDDSAPTAVTTAIAPFAGSFRPEQPLSTFVGKSTAGTWKLRVADTAALDTGTVFCVTLEISRRSLACCGGGGTPLLVGQGAAVSGESCAPANSAVDPGERVTVGFTLANAGSGDTANLVATLLAGSGVQQPSAPQTYGAVTAGGPGVTRSFSFVPVGTCGNNVVPTLSLRDGATDLGLLTFPMRLGALFTSTSTFSNGTAIAVPPAPATSGVGSPYPSNLTIAGLTGMPSKATVNLPSVSHTFPGDLDVLLVAPGGQNVVLMSDVGGGTDLVGTALTFDDDAAASLATGAIVAGTYRPTNIGTGDAFPAPAPAGPHGSSLAGVLGSNPNGTWSLYALDDAASDAGTIGGGWRLNITTSQSVCCSQACSLVCPAPIDTTGNVVTYPFPKITGTCGVVDCTPPSGSTFPTGTTTVSCIASVTGTSCSFPVTVRATRFFTVSPCRLADTRSGSPLQPGVPRVFQINGNCGIPSTARAVALNVTITQPTRAGHVTLHAGGTPVPGTSSLNFGIGQTRANNAVAQLALDGTLSATAAIAAGGSVHLIVDVVGYFE